MMQLTKLELEVLKKYALRYSGFGFPEPHEITVIDRCYTGVGVITHLSSEHYIALDRGYYYYDSFPHIIMEGVSGGLFPSLLIENNSISSLEIATAGSDQWDGTERSWLFEIE